MGLESTAQASQTECPHLQTFCTGLQTISIWLSKCAADLGKMPAGHCQNNSICCWPLPLPKNRSHHTQKIVQNWKEVKTKIGEFFFPPLESKAGTGLRGCSPHPMHLTRQERPDVNQTCLGSTETPHSFSVCTACYIWKNIQLSGQEGQCRTLSVHVCGGVGRCLLVFPAMSGARIKVKHSSNEARVHLSGQQYISHLAHLRDSLTK